MVFQAREEAPCSERMTFVEFRHAFSKVVSPVKVVEFEEERERELREP